MERPRLLQRPRSSREAVLTVRFQVNLAGLSDRRLPAPPIVSDHGSDRDLARHVQRLANGAIVDGGRTASLEGGVLLCCILLARDRPHLVAERRGRMLHAKLQVTAWARH